MRYLLLIIAIWVGFAILRHFLRTPVKQAPKGTSTPVQEMVRCSHCGVHFPRSEAIIQGNDFFCSAEHRDAYQK